MSLFCSGGDKVMKKLTVYFFILFCIFWGSSASAANSATALTDDLEKRVKVLETQVRKLKEENIFQSNQIKRLQTNDESLKEAIGSLASRVSANSNSIQTLNKSVTKLKDLLTIFQGVTRDGDTIIFEGVNVQIISGLGTTSGGVDEEPPMVNGLGNLIVGYNEEIFPYNPGGLPLSDKSGSHNIIVGAGHNYSSYGGIVSGSNNIISGPNSSAISGQLNIASNGGSSVIGGQRNLASGFTAVVTGGFLNQATAVTSSVSGGRENLSSGQSSSVSGGSENTANSAWSSVSGGLNNTAGENNASVSGGRNNAANGFWSSVSGGHNRSVNGIYDWRAGGLFQTE